jgi:hypothetical protein
MNINCPRFASSHIALHPCVGVREEVRSRCVDFVTIWVANLEHCHEVRLRFNVEGCAYVTGG